MVEEEKHSHENVEHHHESTEHHHVEHKKNKWNNWAIFSGVLLILLIVSLFTHGFDFSFVSKDKVVDETADFVNDIFLQGLYEVNVTSVEEKNGLYNLKLDVNSQVFDTYISKDGKLFFPQGFDVETVKEEAAAAGTQTATESQQITKSDKPKVELYVWGYCPYGVQAQGPLAEVAKLLQSKADFEIVPYYDGHGAYETQQNKIQLCVQKLNSDKYWAYATKFVSDVYPKCASTGTEECDKTESIKVMDSLGINSANIFSCVETDGANLFAAASVKAQQNKVSGSPTLIINGMTANVDRTAEAYKTAICGAFNMAPAECDQALSTESGSAEGSC